MSQLCVFECEDANSPGSQGPMVGVKLPILPCRSHRGHLISFTALTVTKPVFVASVCELW